MKNREKYLINISEFDLMSSIEENTGVCPIRAVAGISRVEKAERCLRFVHEGCKSCAQAWLNEEGKPMKLDGRWYTETEANAYVKELKEMLRESRKLIKEAIFVNYKDSNAANKLYDKITKAIGRE